MNHVGKGLREDKIPLRAEKHQRGADAPYGAEPGLRAYSGRPQ